MAVVSPPRTGMVIADRYTLVAELGRGGTSSVWLAEHRLTTKKVALKFMTAEGRVQRARLLREARAACAANHPHICEVHDVLERDGGAPILVLDYLEGESLSKLLAREKRLDPRRVATLGAQAASALGAAHHAGVIHRDIKPHNLFVRRDGRLVVLDFGIAKLQSAQDAIALTDTGSTPGTPAYMAPEQVFGERSADHRADVWGLGMVLYQCLTGVLPTAADNAGQILKRVVEAKFPRVRDLAPEVPEELAMLVESMIEREPVNRPEDMRVVLEVLSEWADEDVPPIDAPGVVETSEGRRSVPAVDAGVATLQGTATDTGSDPAASTGGQRRAVASGSDAMTPPRERRRPAAKWTLAALVVGAAGVAAVAANRLPEPRAVPASAPPQPAVESPSSSADLAAPAASPTQLIAATAAAALLEVSAPPSASAAPPTTASARPRQSLPSLDPLGDRF